MSAAARVAAALAVLQLSVPADARVVVYATRASDTLESIAADYYGNRSLALFIAEDNGLQHDAKLKAGQKIRIPTADRYRIHRGDTLEALAKRFLEDPRRAGALATLNNLRLSDKLREGQELVIPFQHVHRAEAPESMLSVARTFYGDPSKARMLQEFNFRPSPLLAKGDHVLVPIAGVRIRAVRLEAKPAPAVAPHDRVAPPPTLQPAPAPEAQKREEELAQRVGARLKLAERAYDEGAYAEVPAALDKLLASEDPSESQLAEIFRLKAYAYTALGMEELAVSSFREVLARKPELTLDAALVSPKIRAALDRARRAPAP